MKRLLLALLILSACGRPLTDGEAAFMEDLQGKTFNAARARLHVYTERRSVTFKRQKRPRVTCQERIFPEPKGETVTATTAAVALFSRVFFSSDYYTEDYMKDYPERINLYAAMLFAHEATHIWQWQNRKITGYHPLKAASEHIASSDPYLFEVDSKTRWLDLPYEQQASVVEEYICCQALDPEAPRTTRLRDMLREAFPLGDLKLPKDIILPWDDAKTQGICR